MDREQIIEEILSRFCEDHGNDNTCRFLLYGKKCKDIDCFFRRKAIDIVDKYIPEGAVVLTREELEAHDKEKAKARREGSKRKKKGNALKLTLKSAKDKKLWNYTAIRN